MLTFLFLLYQYINAKMISQKFNFYNDRPILHLSYLIDNSIATPFVNTYHSYSLIDSLKASKVGPCCGGSKTILTFK